MQAIYQKSYSFIHSSQLRNHLSSPEHSIRPISKLLQLHHIYFLHIKLILRIAFRMFYNKQLISAILNITKVLFCGWCSEDTPHLENTQV